MLKPKRDRLGFVIKDFRALGDSFLKIERELERTKGESPHSHIVAVMRELSDMSKLESAPTESLLEWMRVVYNGLSQFEDAPPEPLDAESIEGLRSLGYVD